MPRSSKIMRALTLIFILALAPLARGQAPLATPKNPQAEEAAKRRAMQMLQGGPAVFIENQGQWPDEDVRFALTGGGANVGLTSASLRFQLFKREPLPGATAGPNPRPMPGRDEAKPQFTTKLHEFQARFAGAKLVKPEGVKKSEQVFHFRRGDRARWRESVPSWESVRYAGLYAGVDLTVMGRKGGIKYEYHLAPGADWKRIALKYENVAGLKVREDGALELTPAEGWPALVDGAPAIYQQTDSGRKDVAGRFRMIDARTVGFEITGEYDKSKELVIDPELIFNAE